MDFHFAPRTELQWNGWRPLGPFGFWNRVIWKFRRFLYRRPYQYKLQYKYKLLIDNIAGGDLGDVAVVYNSNLYLFGVSPGDARHYVNVFYGSYWSGWSAVPGEGRSLSSDAAAVYKGKLYLFGIGINDRGHYVNVFDGSNWGGWSAVPGGLSTWRWFPDVAVLHGEKLYLFGIDSSSRSQNLNVFDGQNWSGWSPVPGATAAGHQAAVEYNGKLYLFTTSNRPNSPIMNIFDGSNWSGWMPVESGLTVWWDSGNQQGTFLNDVSDALVYDSKLYLFGTGTGGGNVGIYTNVFDGSKWSGWNRIPGSDVSPLSPTSAVFNQKLNLFAIGGYDGQHYVNVLGI